MLQNYFKIAFRHIARNKSYLLINVIGLGVAFACCIVAYVNYQYANQADSFHEKKDQIFHVTVSNVGSSWPNVNVVAPLMPKAVTEISAVKEGVRIDDRSVVVQIGAQVFSEQLTLVDPNFFDIFSFPIVKGTAAALANPTSVLLSEETAKRYFGTQNPIGETITIDPGKPWQKELIIGGIVQDPASNSSIQFDLLTHISFAETGAYPDSLSNWGTTLGATFLLLNDREAAIDVTQSLNRYLALENKIEGHREVTKYHLDPMDLVFHKRQETQNNSVLIRLENPLLPVVPAIMAFLILLTACLNFTNTTISFSNKRLKEMGVRKVMGSNRRQLITQLLGESFIICLLAIGLGMVIATYLMPLYNETWAFMNMEFTLDYLGQPHLLGFLALAVLFTSLLGGAYPAFYMSSFKTTSIFRGNTKFGGDTWLVRSLLGLQIVISLITIIGGITFAQNAEFQKNYDLGYDAKGVINVPIQEEAQYHQLKAAIASNPDILGIAGSMNNLGFSSWWSNMGRVEDNRHVLVQHIGENFLEVMDIDLLEGRTFDQNKALDFEETVLVNQKLVDQHQWESGIGQEIDIGGKSWKVIGVTQNFTHASLFEPISPSLFFLKKPKDYRNIKVKVVTDKLIATNAYLKNTWTENFPFVPYEGYYQDEVLAITLAVSEGISRINIFLSLIAILLAATGLFSLVSLNLLKRAKEIAIRRVLGASTGSIAYLINKHYLLIFLVGGLIGGIGGLYTADFLLENIFKIHQGANTFSTLLAVGFVCVIGALTIGGRLIGVLRTNPADTLRSD